MEFSYVEKGNPNGHPLIFLHGFLGCKEDFLPLMEALANEYRCLALDLPGHGGTPLFAREDELWMATLVKLAFFMQHHSLQKASFVGYSMGGRILLKFCEHFGHLVDQAFFLSAHLGGEKGREEEWIQWLKEGNMEQFLERWYAQALFTTLRLDAELLKRRRKNDPEKLIQVLRGFSLGRQKRYTAEEKMWFFYGQHDRKYRELYQDVRSKWEIQEGGHAIHLEKPHQIAIMIRRVFLEPRIPLGRLSQSVDGPYAASVISFSCFSKAIRFSLL